MKFITSPSSVESSITTDLSALFSAAMPATPITESAVDWRTASASGVSASARKRVCGHIITTALPTRVKRTTRASCCHTSPARTP